MDIAAALEYFTDRRETVLVTARRDGRPQLSNVWSKVGTDNVIRISATADRAKTQNAVRDPRVSLYATGDDFGSYVVIDGSASVTPEAADPHDATVEALVALYRSFGAEHPNWDDYRAAMVRERRVVIAVTPTHAYGRSQ
jgi:PPOX class probable F420-dependent enzyme